MRLNLKKKKRIKMQGVLKSIFHKYTHSKISSKMIEDILYKVGLVQGEDKSIFIGYRERYYDNRPEREHEIAFSELVLFREGFSIEGKRADIIGKIQTNQGITEYSLPMDCRDARFLGSDGAGLFLKILSDVNRLIRILGGPL